SLGLSEGAGRHDLALLTALEAPARRAVAVRLALERRLLELEQVRVTTEAAEDAGLIGQVDCRDGGRPGGQAEADGQAADVPASERVGLAPRRVDRAVVAGRVCGAEARRVCRRAVQTVVYTAVALAGGRVADRARLDVREVVHARGPAALDGARRRGQAQATVVATPVRQQVAGQEDGRGEGRIQDAGLAGAARSHARCVLRQRVDD